MHSSKQYNYFICDLTGATVNIPSEITQDFINLNKSV